MMRKITSVAFIFLFFALIANAPVEIIRHGEMAYGAVRSNILLVDDGLAERARVGQETNQKGIFNPIKDGCFVLNNYALKEEHASFLSESGSAIGRGVDNSAILESPFTMDSKEIKLSGILVEGNFIVGEKFDSLQLYNSKIVGCILFEGANSIKVQVVISEDSEIGGIYFTRQGALENNGYIRELKADAPVEIIRQGKIDYAAVGSDSFISDDGSIVLIRGGKATKQKGFIRILGDEYYALDDYTLAKGLTRIDGKSYYFDDAGKRKNGYIQVGEVMYYFLYVGGVATGRWVDNYYRADYDGVLVKSIMDNDELDTAVGSIISKITNDNMSERDKMLAAYRWIQGNIGWRGISVDTSNGYTDTLVSELALYTVKNRKGSCEHFASISAVLLRRLGYRVNVTIGTRLDSASGTWGEHAWVRVLIDGTLYHFDPQFAANHMKNNLLGAFLVSDDDFRGTHRW